MFRSRLPFYLTLVLCMTTLGASASHAGGAKPANWKFPEALLAFDESRYEQSADEAHATLPEAEADSLWNILGKYEARAHLHLGIQHFNENDFPLAEAEYEKSLEIDPDNAFAHFNLGLLYFTQKKYKPAEDQYKEALKLDPSLNIAHNNLGTLHLVKKEYKAATRDFLTAVKLDPKDLKAHISLGHLYFYVFKNYPAARESYQRALGINPEVQVAKANLATIRKDENKAKEMERQFEQSIEMSENDAHDEFSTTEDFEESPSQETKAKGDDNSLFTF